MSVHYLQKVKIRENTFTYLFSFGHFFYGEICNEFVLDNSGLWNLKDKSKALSLSSQRDDKRADQEEGYENDWVGNWYSGSEDE